METRNKISIIRLTVAKLLITASIPLMGQTSGNLALQGINNSTPYNSLVDNTVSSHYNAGILKDAEGDLEHAVIEFSAAIKLDPKFADAYDKRGIAYTKMIKYQKALKDFNKAIEIKNDFSEAYNHRGIVYYCLQEFEKSIQDYNKAIELKPDYDKVYYNRGIVELVLDDESGAFTDFSKASSMNNKEAKDYISNNPITSN
jgi:tetratricopeptide (TPR) repeat protein